MFIDTAHVFVSSGKGGDGSVSFHREKFVPKGGPDGGDGGDGGSVYLVGNPNINTLAEFRHTPKLYAQNGQPGKGQCKSGKKGKDLKVNVPLGTLARDEATGQPIAEILEIGQTVLIAEGGKGGRGNWHFKTSTDQAPRRFERGTDGLSFKCFLELKVMADVGLVGFPNAGKSSLIASVSHAKPKIANYPFTTLEPCLGVIDLPDFKTIVMADIPGIIEGAAHGKGLGIQFLKHLERTKILLFVIDISEYADVNPVLALDKLKFELEEFGHGIKNKEYLIAANKIDLDCDKVQLKKFLALINKDDKNKVFPVSTATKKGLDKLIAEIVKNIHN